jgi:uncharacterized membrane protein YeaQ/YmgE (transglycosylase-associated protein family)
MDLSLLFSVFIGALSGYVASKILGGDGFGFFGNIVVGVIGGYLGGWVVKVAKVPIISGFFGQLVSSVGGALILIFFIELIKYMQRNNAQRSRKRSR